MRLLTTALPLLLSLTQAHAAPQHDDDGDYTPEPTYGEEPPAAAPTYAICGGYTQEGTIQCAEGFLCVDDPRKEGCGMACDDTGICVPEEAEMCGGFAGFACPEGLICIDYPNDGCDPQNGGADCGGMCV